MYNTPDKHNPGHIGRSKFDFSDIDHLDRATEAFLKEQRKALGHRAINLDAVAEQGKRALVFIVLGAVFVTALVAGIRFGISDNELRDPKTSVTDSVVESGTHQTTNGSSSDQPKDDANGAATTAPNHEAESSVTTDPTTAADEPALSTTLPQLTESDVVMLTTTTTTKTTVGTAVTTLSEATNSKKTTTSKTTTPKTTTKTTATTSKATTPKTTITTTITSTTAKTTVTSTTTKKTTTTTTTTTVCKANLSVKSVRVVSCTQQDADFITEVRVYLKNSGNAAASNVSTTVGVNNCSYVSTVTDNWSASLSGGCPSAKYFGTVAPGEEVYVSLFFISSSYVSSCSANCSYT